MFVIGAKNPRKKTGKFCFNASRYDVRCFSTGILDTSFTGGVVNFTLPEVGVGEIIGTGCGVIVGVATGFGVARDENGLSERVVTNTFGGVTDGADGEI